MSVNIPPPPNPEESKTIPGNTVFWGYDSGMALTTGGSRGFIGASQSIGVDKTDNVAIGHNGFESTILSEPRVFIKDNLTLSPFGRE